MSGIGLASGELMLTTGALKSTEAPPGAPARPGGQRRARRHLHGELERRALEEGDTGDLGGRARLQCPGASALHRLGRDGRPGAGDLPGVVHDGDQAAAELGDGEHVSRGRLGERRHDRLAGRQAIAVTRPSGRGRVPSRPAGSGGERSSGRRTASAGCSLSGGALCTASERMPSRDRDPSRSASRLTTRPSERAVALVSTVVSTGVRPRSTMGVPARAASTSMRLAPPAPLNGVTAAADASCAAAGVIAAPGAETGRNTAVSATSAPEAKIRRRMS